MPEIIRHKSGALLFYLTEEEQKIEDTIQESRKLKEKNKDLEERLEKLERLLSSQDDKTSEEATEEVKTPKRRKKATE